MQSLEFSHPIEEQTPPSAPTGSVETVFMFGAEESLKSLLSVVKQGTTEVEFSYPAEHVSPKPKDKKPSIRPFSH